MVTYDLFVMAISFYFELCKACHRWLDEVWWQVRFGKVHPQVIGKGQFYTMFKPLALSVGRSAEEAELATGHVMCHTGASVFAEAPGICVYLFC